MSVEVPLGPIERHRLLQAHHDRVGEAAQQHDNAEHHVHDADALVIDAGEPLAPEIAPELVVADRRQQRGAADRHRDEGGDDDRLVQRQRFEREPAEDRADGRDGWRHRAANQSGL